MLAAAMSLKLTLHQAPSHRERATNALGVLFINQLPPRVVGGIVALRGFQFFRGVFLLARFSSLGFFASLREMECEIRPLVARNTRGDEGKSSNESEVVTGV